MRPEYVEKVKIANSKTVKPNLWETTLTRYIYYTQQPLSLVTLIALTNGSTHLDPCPGKYCNSRFWV